MMLKCTIFCQFKKKKNYNNACCCEMLYFALKHVNFPHLRKYLSFSANRIVNIIMKYLKIRLNALQIRLLNVMDI